MSLSGILQGFICNDILIPPHFWCESKYVSMESVQDEESHSEKRPEEVDIGEEIPQPTGKTVAEVIGEAREKIRAFAIDLVGITELHPNNSPSC